MPGPINPFQGKICSKNLFIQQNLPILALFNPCFAKVFCDFPASEGGGTSRAFPLRFFWQNSFRKGRRGKGVPRSLKSVLVLPPQIFGLFGPPRKRVNFDKFNQRQKCVFCVLTALYVSK